MAVAVACSGHPAFILILPTPAGPKTNFSTEDSNPVHLMAYLPCFGRLCHGLVWANIRALLDGGRDISHMFFEKRVLELALLRALGVRGDDVELRMMREVDVSFGGFRVLF